MDITKVDGVTLAFLTELKAISKKYGIYIDGCGCCGSPYLYRKDSSLNKYNYNNLGYNNETDKYETD